MELRRRSGDGGQQTAVGEDRLVAGVHASMKFGTVGTFRHALRSKPAEGCACWSPRYQIMGAREQAGW